MNFLTKVPVVVAMVTVTMMVSVQEARTARILMLQPVCTRSHKNFFMAIAENLVLRNHTVTLLTDFKSSHQRPNIKEIVVPGVNFQDDLPNLFEVSSTMLTWYIFPKLVTSCSEALGSDEVQTMLQEEFDLVMMYIGMTECFLPFIHERKVPFIYVNPNTVQGMYSDIAGTPHFPSLVASYSLNLEYPLTFTGRMISTITDLLGMAFMNFLLSRQEAECRARKLCPDDMPSLDVLRFNSSLFITNSVGTMENPTLPYTPTVVHAGGIQCRPAKPLPMDLEEWVTGAGKHGVILFSLGSLVKSTTMPEEYRKVLVEVFGSLQQRVLWKWDEDTMEGLPPNVRMSRWLPQQDILGHPQLRLFITHGGLFSTHEATYHGVPMLGLPVSIDQHHNMRKVQREGWGRVLYWEDLTYDNLRSHIMDIMNDSRFSDEAQRRARVMRDQPVPPGDWVTYWVEYVLRHNGARHLHSPAMDIPWYQLYNVDVWAVVVVVTVAAVGLASWLLFKILRVLVGCCCRSGKTKKD